MDWRSYFDHPIETTPQWALEAPERLIYLSNRTGTWQVYGWDRARSVTRRITDEPGGVHNAALTSDGRHVLWFRDQTGSETGEWRLRDFDTDDDVPLDPDLPTGPTSTLITGPNRKVALAIATGESQTLFAGTAGEPLRPLASESNPLSPTSFDSDGSRLLVNHATGRTVMKPAARVYDLDGTLRAELSDQTDQAILGPQFSPVPREYDVVFLHEREALMRPGLWDSAGDRRRDLKLDLPGDIEIADWSGDGRHLILVHSHRGRDEMWLYEVDTDLATRVEHRSGTVTSVTARPDGHIWARISSGGRSARVEQIGGGPVRAESTQLRGTDYQPWQFDDDNGLTLHGFLVRPAGDPPYRTVLLVHGGPHQHDADTWNSRVQALVAEGWAVAMVNYRGSTGQGIAWLDAATGDPGAVQVDDIVAARGDLVRSGFARPDRIALAGGSWGGYLTLLTIGMVPDRWYRAAALAPLADLVGAYRTQQTQIRRLLDSLYGGSPERHPELYRDRSPINYSHRVRTPVLIVTGDHDTRCPREQVESYVDALREAGVDCRLSLYPSGHLPQAAHQRMWIETLLGFLDETPDA